MKIAIELEDYEVKGIKKYLKELDPSTTITKEQVQSFCAGQLIGLLYAEQEAVSYYIQQAQQGWSDSELISKILQRKKV